MNTIFKVSDRVRHKDENINKEKGILTILEIKGEFAFCSNNDYHNFGSIAVTYPLKDLKLAEN